MNRASTSFLLPDPAQMALIDAAASRVVPVRDLMEHAGRAVARAVRRHVAPCRVLVLCGPGNNGGDGYVAARRLAEAGWPVAVAALAPPRPDGDAAHAASLWRGPVVPFGAAEAARADLVIDAVFGAGLSRDIDDDLARVLAAARRIVAVDMPSGIDGATGAVRGYAPHAEMTVTFVRAKPGHLLLPGRDMLGRLVVADIGMPDSVWDAVAVRTWQNEPGLWQVPQDPVDSHKYTRGVVSICGGASMPGAARLAAAGARAAGAGLVRLAAGEVADLYRLGDPGLVVDGQALEDLLSDQRRAVWVCGPGLTVDEVGHALPLLLGAGRRVLVDAGAFLMAAGRPELLRGAAVITPHAGEFARVFGAPGADRLAAARAAAARIDGVVVLKGPDTVIAAPDGRAAINRHASTALATAGSGDTLTGVIATMLAAGMEAWQAACAGVWLHGEAGMRAGPWPVAEQFDRHLGAARERAALLGRGTRGEV
ncbi:NAD(P)H-hydrate dehydratase [Gluconacetobacter azotocaptans]|uniref:Bifunctional NAD(P)H-hydrate repair enzyme n=1 Tax=Gluconacetobacter azotocaptans TaxID=142834 RepID=A0A7W4JUQ9_9PROT|nr:NAD(P)H-hydrate dehydratase [Gluconacetobacter azotocaptans]MBB2191180.1 NAD(P)H-hydrate dehydratase [Gluconacetobacter azotocaptans]GBQ29050.1 sugar kinase [Gluconacetobacter azotocaptans DSM 13594]